MAINLSSNIFTLIPEAANNENTRPGALMLEYFQFDFTIDTLEDSIELPTSLGTVLFGVFGPVLAAADDPTDSIVITSDYIITSGAITVQCKCIDIANGALTVRGFLVGTRSATVLLNDPE